MPVVYRTLTGNAGRLLGLDLPVTDLSIRARTNVPAGKPLIDQDGHRFLLGTDYVRPTANGDFVLPNVLDFNSTGLNWDHVAYYIDLVFNDPVTRRTLTITLGPYEVTADTDIADLEDTQGALPPALASAYRSEIQGYVDDARDISQIATPDGVVGALIAGTGGSGGLTRAAITGVIAAFYTPVDNGNGTLTLPTGLALDNGDGTLTIGATA